MPASSRLLACTRDLPPGSHCAALTASADECLSLATHVVLQALEIGEKVTVVLAPSELAGVLDRLAAVGRDTAADVAQGKLVLLDSAEVYLTGGQFDSARALARLSAHMPLLADPARCWAVVKMPTLPDDWHCLAEFGLQISRVARNTALVAVGLFAMAELSFGHYLAVGYGHDFMWCGGKLVWNPLYRPPGLIPAEPVGPKQLSVLVGFTSNLIRQARRQEALQFLLQQGLAPELGYDAVCRQAIIALTGAVSAQAGAVYLRAAEGDTLSLVCPASPPATFPAVLPAGSDAWQSLTSGTAILSHARVGVRSLLLAPIQAAGQPFGVIAACHSASQAFNEDDRLTAAMTGEILGLLLQSLQHREGLAVEAALMGLLAERRSWDGTNVALSDVGDAVSAEIARVTQPEAVCLWLLEGSPPQPVRRGVWSRTGTGLAQGPGRAVGAPGPDILVGGRSTVVLTGSGCPPGQQVQVMLIPLSDDGVVLGHVSVRAPQGRRFHVLDLALGETIGRLAGAVVRGARSTRSQVHLERMRAVGTLAAGIAHDVNNMVTAIAGASQALRAHIGGDKGLAYLSAIEAAATGAAAMVERIRFLSSPGESNACILCDLREVIASCLALLETHLRRQEIEHRVDCSEPLPMKANPHALTQVLVNLVLNSADAMPDGGRLDVSARGDDADAVLVVRDSGHGMNREVLAQAFEPFFTTKGTRGTGLGLALVRDVVRQHGGSVDLASEPGRGTTCTIRLPLARDPSART